MNPDATIDAAAHAISAFAEGVLKKGKYTLKVKLSDDTYFTTRATYVVR